jgi:hypothetical protein
LGFPTRTSIKPSGKETDMAQGQRPQYNVFVFREIEAGKNSYTKIGSAWNVAKEGISITL